MKKFVMGVASISIVALLGLAACAGEAEGTGDPAAADGAPAAEASQALAGASSCGAFVQNHINWMKNPSSCGGSGGAVYYNIATHQGSGLVSHTTGRLDRTADATIFIDDDFVVHQLPARLFSDWVADGSQSFSDRRVSARIAGETFDRSFSFDPRARDGVKVALKADGTMTFKLVSWGGGEINVQPTECMNNLMYGFGNGVLYSISLKDECVPG